MNKAEPLEPHGTPKALYERVRAGLEGETQRTGLPLHVGGGGVLEPRWDHRGSLDSDVVIQRDNPDAARRALDRAAEQSDGYRVQEPGFDRSELPDLPREEDVDVRPPFCGHGQEPGRCRPEGNRRRHLPAGPDPMRGREGGASASPRERGDTPWYRRCRKPSATPAPRARGYAA